MTRVVQKTSDFKLRNSYDHGITTKTERSRKSAIILSSSKGVSPSESIEAYEIRW